MYSSPEILMKEKFSFKSDIWSLGVLFYELLYGKTPWNGKTELDLIRNMKKS
jgi:serine/threonine-protein kinase ULK2